MPRSSTTKSRSATSAPGCTKSCSASRPPGTRRTRPPRKRRDCWPSRSRCSRSAISRPAAFLPFAATFSRVAPRYIEWLHRRDASGARWQGSEVDLRAHPPDWNGIEMHGIIDRIDRVIGPDGPTPELIDYKTGSAERLRTLVKRPQEDTQLAFYAALLAGQGDADVAPSGDVPAARRARHDQARRASGCRRARPSNWCRALAANCGALPPALRCRLWAKARRASIARRVACAGATTGRRRRRPDERRPARDACVSNRRTARITRSVLCGRMRSASQRHGRGLRRRRQDVDAGVAHSASVARWLRAARDPGDHVHAQGGGRDAGAAVRVAVGFRGPAQQRRRARERTARARTRRSRGPRAGAGIGPPLRKGARVRTARRDPHLSRLVRPAAARRAARAAGPARPARRHGGARRPGRAPRAHPASIPCGRAGGCRSDRGLSRARPRSRPFASAQVVRCGVGQARRDRDGRCGRHARAQRPIGRGALARASASVASGRAPALERRNPAVARCGRGDGARRRNLSSAGRPCWSVRSRSRTTCSISSRPMRRCSP